MKGSSTISNLIIIFLQWTEHKFFKVLVVERTTQQGKDFCDIVFNFITLNLISIKILQRNFPPYIGSMFLWIFKAIHLKKKSNDGFEEVYLGCQCASVSSSVSITGATCIPPWSVWMNDSELVKCFEFLG